MSSERFHVRISKDYLVFCCAHFISYDGDQCEKLHGHNYRAAVELTGPIDENSYLFDFVTLKNYMRQITDELDHHVLLATENRHIRVEASDTSVRATYRHKEWVFPREDVVLLAIANTTAELIARWLARRLLSILRESHGFVPDSLRMEVEETFGQAGFYEIAPVKA